MSKKNEVLFMTARQYKEIGFDKVVIPLGSTEAHGYHLPIGCDTLVSYKLAKKVADQCDGMLVSTPLVVGYSMHYDSFPYSMSLSYETCAHVIYDYIESAIRNGIEKILLISNHDGNSAPCEIATRRIKEKYPNVRIAACDWWAGIANYLPADFFESPGGLGHGGEFETSAAYYLFKELCEPEYAADIMPVLPDYLDVKWDFSELTDRGQTGAATKGSEEKGKVMIETAVAQIVKEVKALDAKNWDYTTPGHCQKPL